MLTSHTRIILVTVIAFGCAESAVAPTAESDRATLQASRRGVIDRVVLRNGDFSSGLDHWYTANGLDWREHPQAPGNVSWSPSYGGSAQMSVSGAPSSVNLIQATGADLLPGDVLTFDFVTSGMTAAQFAVQIGNSENGGERAALVEPGDGQHRLVMRLARRHARGTMIQLTLVTWPGAATCWVTDVSWTKQ
jgi:hypothetical protein